MKEPLTKQKPTPHGLLARDTMVSKYAEDVLNLITFGLCCPLLGLAISISMLLNGLIQRGLIGRFLLAREESICPPPTGPTPPFVSASFFSSTLPIPTPPADLTLLALDRALVDLDSSYYHLIWVVLWSSCFFISFICWDIAGDTMGALGSVWLPSIAIAFVLSLQLFERYSESILPERNSESVRESGIALGSAEHFNRP